jgi:hypothetical protein
VEIPGSVDPGKHRLKAGCNGHGLGSVKITVHRSRFKVEPRTVAPGDPITVSGSLCKPGSYVTIKLDGERIGDDRANRKGKFRTTVEIPVGTRTEDPHRVSARCHGRFVGSQLVEVVTPYPAPLSLLTVDRTAVAAGQAVSLGGSKCPAGHPLASLDGRPVRLRINRTGRGKGFTAIATIPSTVAPGAHTLWAGCVAGSSGTTELHVLDGR